VDWLFGLSDRTIGIVGALLGAMSILYAIHTHRQNRFPKRLVHEIGPTFALAKVYDSDVPITLRYKEIGTNAVYRTLVLIWNKGWAPIESSDVLEPLHISWTPAAPVVGAGILAKDAFSLVSLAHSSDAADVRIDVLRSNEACLLYLDSVHGPATLTMRSQLKHAGSTGTFNLFEVIKSPFMLVYIAVMATVGAVMITAAKLLRGHEGPSSAATLFMIAIFGLPLLAGIVTHTIFRRRLSPTVRRFFDEEGRNVERMFRR
jgi:hypothetical protein